MTEGSEFESSWGQDFSFSHLVQTGSEAHLAFYQMDTRGKKRPEREADHSPATSSEIKITWIHTSTSPYIFMA
jgi:hypothetical protein